MSDVAGLAFLPPVLTTEQAAGLLQCSTKLVRELALTKQLPGRKVGKDWRFPRDAVLAYVAGAEVAPALTRKAK